MSSTYSRRQWITAAGAAAWLSARPSLSGASKPLRGVFIILATPYTDAREVDYEDLARQVGFMERCGVHGMVWPQLASEYYKLTTEERMRGMEVIAKAAKGTKPALVFGVQGPDTGSALAYARHAAKLEADAMIAIPPTGAKTLDDFRQYYRALAKSTRRPLFIQTTGGAKGITLEIELLVELAREFPHCAYVKEEHAPVLDRMKKLAANRPTIKGVFSGMAGRGMMYEMRLGFDGTMPGAPFADIYAQIWNLYQAGDREKSRDLFSRLLLMIELDQQIPGTRQYIMKKRGVFKTAVSRVREFQFTPEAIAEVEFQFEALKPYLKT